MRKQLFLFFILTAACAAFCMQEVKAQSGCDKALIAAENLYQSGQLYDIPERLLPCLESGFNYQEKQSAYRLLVLTYLNINREEQAKSTLHKLLRLNPDYLITKEKDPVELYNLYRQFRVDPVFYIGMKGGAVVTSPVTLRQRSSSSLGTGAGKSYQPFYGFSLGGDFAFPLLKNLLLEFSPAYGRSSYRFQSFYLTNAFPGETAQPQVQEVTGRETYHSVMLPLSLNLRIPAGRGRLAYTLGAGAGTSILLASAFNDVNRINRQIFTEEINVSRIKTTPNRRGVNIAAHLEAGLEYKYQGYFWGVRAGLCSTFLNYTSYPGQQEMFLNTMSTNFGWLDDDFVLANGYFSVFVRKPLYKFL